MLRAIQIYRRNILENAYISKSVPKQNTFHVSISLQMFTDCIVCYSMESVLLHGIFYSHRNVIPIHSVCVSMVWIWEKRLNFLHHTGNCIRKERRKKRRKNSACGHFFLSPQISERDIISVVVVSGVH